MPVEVARDSVTIDLECEIVEDDEGDVLGEEDEVKVEEEIEEIGVVLAETGSGSNIFVYVIQTLLTLSTLLSGIFFSKKYIM
jgi:hypothetical protein